MTAGLIEIILIDPTTPDSLSMSDIAASRWLHGATCPVSVTHPLSTLTLIASEGMRLSQSSMRAARSAISSSSVILRLGSRTVISCATPLTPLTPSATRSARNLLAEALDVSRQFDNALPDSDADVSFAQSILYRGAGIDVVWPEFLAVAGIASLFFSLAILRFRSIASQAM